MKSDKLFSEFPPVSTEQWEEVIMADLKGGDYEKKLIWKTIEGIDVRPYYRAENIKDLNIEPTTKKDNNWDIRQDIFESDIKLANQIALEGLKRGVNAIGFDASKVQSDKDMEVLLNGIDLTKVKVNFFFATCFLELTKRFIAYVKAKSIDGTKVYGSMNFDPYIYSLYSGKLCCSDDEIAEQGAQIINLIKENIPNFDAVTVNGHLFNNAGASIVQELAYTLSAANEYLASLTAKGIPAHSVGYRTVFAFATGSNYFMEIAKIRAARILWKKIMQEYNPKCDSAYDLFIATESSFYNKTIYDPYVNMLRTTTETMSAAIAGADSISVYPFDCAFKESDDFSRRIASNQQVLLKEESHFDKVVDPSAGSYYIENLTSSIASHAWDIFKQIEEKGGFLKAIKEGYIQDEVNKTAQKRSKEVAMRKTTILGTNQYPNQTEEMSSKIESICHGYENPANEIKTLNCDRLAEPFEKLRLDVEKSSNKPKVFLLTYGNLAMRKARAGFASNFFAVSGYQIIDNAGFDTVEAGAKAALDSKAEIVVLCSSDEEYVDLVAGVTPLLKGKVNHIVVAGNPVDQIENFKNQGITDFISVKTNALESLQNYNKLLLK
ncbi:MAG: methylmalonyl-CoA mutase [Bacteroidetes bacterium]|nr:methylmalonyl-CoA mutase [Bacteroidota bacterium]